VDYDCANKPNKDMAPKLRKPSSLVTPKNKEKNHSDHGFSIYFIGLLGFILIVLCNWLIDFEYYYKSISNNINNKHKRNKVHLGSVTKNKNVPLLSKDWFTINKDKVSEVQWNSSDTMRIISKSRNPLLVKGSSVLKTWPMFQWDLLEIANSSQKLALNGTRWQPLPVFVLGRDRDKGGMLGSSRDHPLSYTNVSVMQFLQSTFDPKTFLYWTGELSTWEEGMGTSINTKNNANETATGESFGDWRDFRIRDEGIKISDEQGEDDLWRPMLWLSHPGVVAQTHYDTQHNMFIQVQGSKRFLLFPPATNLYSYPHIHRSYRQSQVHLEMDRATTANATSKHTTFPLVHPSNVSAYEVVLAPGDVLYIPPYWQHRVESLTLSLSLSILSPARLAAALAEVYWENVPFGEFQGSRELRTRAVSLYLSLLVDKLSSSIFDGTLKEFASEVYETRFATLNMRHKVFHKDGTCFGPIDANTTALMDSNRAQFEQGASNIAAMMERLDAASAVKVIFLRDYLEEITRWAVGPDYTASHIRDCLE
jgi:hypothetical protein